MATNIFLGRQPLLDISGRTFGYELLYRDGPKSATFFDDPDDATRRVMERALLQWGMEHIIGDRFGLINADASLVRLGLHLAMPPEGIIFELHEPEPLDQVTMDAIQLARREGYHFALDNISNIDQLETSHLLPHVSIVKIELTTANESQLQQMVDFIRSRVPNVLVAATKVESQQIFDQCSAIGFDLFQGYFFAEPEILSRSARPAASVSAVALMAEMQNGEIDIDRTVALVGSDPSLAFRLLSVVNSSAFGLNRRVDSLRHAIVLIGLTQLRHLAALIALSSSKPANEELLTLGSVRARFASQIVPNKDDRSSAFTVGLLSVTDAIFQAPMSDLVNELPLSASVADALVNGTGTLGETLRIVRACESADPTSLAEFPPEHIQFLQEEYGKAIQWADNLRSQLGPPETGDTKSPRWSGSAGRATARVALRK